MPSEFLVISTSLRAGSVSRLLGQFLAQELEGDYLDLRDHPLPFCDGDVAYDDPNVEKLRARIRAARVIFLAVPIYNYDGNAAAKNLIELTGGAWEDKIVGFACAAGGQSSYMSIMGLANDLMLDFRCVILPRFVYATGADFNDGQITSPKIQQRLKELADAARRLRMAP
jgi:NAD(P)H-dependent FMN reductase